MNMEKGNMNNVSWRLSYVMEDIGVSEELLKFRRHVCRLEDMFASFGCFSDTSSRRKKAVFHTFGSQIEGSTTVGMNSAFDILCYLTRIRACLNDAQQDPSYVNFLLVQDLMSFPQCCSLQSPLFCSTDTGSKWFYKMNPESLLEIIDQKARAWVKSSFVLRMDNLKEHYGPSIAVEDANIQIVPAIYCIAPPEDCLVLFQRPRPGHWPHEKTLTKVRQCGIFLLKPGTLSHTFDFDSTNHTGNLRVQHPHDYAAVQWKMCTTLTESLLMFDLNLVQMKTYTLTKMIKNELFGDYLSSFHMKTALLFTVEQFPEEIWTDDNLMQCVLYCLNTLRRFVRRRHCPHYTVAKVDLFTGKLQEYQFQSLNYILTSLIESNLSCIFAIQIDCIGERLYAILTDPNAYRSTGEKTQSKFIKTLFFKKISANFDQLGFCRRKEEIALIESQIKFEYENSVEYRHELEYILQNISSTRASIAASACIQNKKPITEEIQKLYEHSMCSENIANRLKYASMLVCTKQFKQAEAQLDAIEKLITPYMVPFSSDRPSQNKEPEALTKAPCPPSEIFMGYLRKLLFPVAFLREELKCLPSHLIFEMYRTITEEDKSASQSRKVTHWTVWFDTATIDALPFLYYLRYLSTGNKEEKSNAYHNLRVFMESDFHMSRLGHLDTNLNIMGYFEEQQKNLPLAWKMYTFSIELFPRNNAAYWHLFRLLGQVVYGTATIYKGDWSIVPYKGTSSQFWMEKMQAQRLKEPWENTSGTQKHKTLEPNVESMLIHEVSPKGDIIKWLKFWMGTLRDEQLNEKRETTSGTEKQRTLEPNVESLLMHVVSSNRDFVKWFDFWMETLRAQQLKEKCETTSEKQSTWEPNGESISKHTEVSTKRDIKRLLEQLNIDVMAECGSMLFPAFRHGCAALQGIATRGKDIFDNPVFNAIERQIVFQRCIQLYTTSTLMDKIKASYTKPERLCHVKTFCWQKQNVSFPALVAVEKQHYVAIKHWISSLNEDITGLCVLLVDEEPDTRYIAPDWGVFQSMTTMSGTFVAADDLLERVIFAVLKNLVEKCVDKYGPSTDLSDIEKESTLQSIYKYARAAYKRSAVPEPERPVLPETSYEYPENIDSVIKGLLEIEGVVGCSKNIGLLEVIIESTNDSDTAINRVNIYLQNKRVKAVFIHGRLTPLISSGDKVSKEGITATLGGFAKKIPKTSSNPNTCSSKAAAFIPSSTLPQHSKGTLVALIARHVATAIGCEGLHVKNNIGTFDIGQIKNIHNYPLVDIIPVDIYEHCIHQCDGQFKTEIGMHMYGQLCSTEEQICEGYEVYIWGAETSPGFGTIAAVDLETPNGVLLTIHDRNEGESFCREGDSGAMVCATDRREETLYAIAMIQGKLEGRPGRPTYVAVSLKKGFKILGSYYSSKFRLCNGDASLRE